MFFLSNRTCRTGLSRFGKLTFPKSADSQFLKTADCDYSEICRNKVTAYSSNTVCPLSFSRLTTFMISHYLVPPDGIAPYRSKRPLVRTDIPLLFLFQRKILDVKLGSKHSVKFRRIVIHKSPL